MESHPCKQWRDYCVFVKYNLNGDISRVSLGISPELWNHVRIMEYGIAGDVTLPKRQKCVHRDKNVGVCCSAPRILSQFPEFCTN